MNSCLAEKRNIDLTLIATALPRPSCDLAKVDPRSQALIHAVLGSLEDSKAEEIVTLDLAGKTTLADVMIIATGRSNTHVGAIADRLTRSCKEVGAAPRVEGLPHCDWVLVDAADVIIHIFRPEVRQFYNLEKMWGGDRPGDVVTELRKPSKRGA